MPQINCDIEDSVFYEIGGHGDDEDRHELCQHEVQLLMKNVNNPDMKVLKTEGTEEAPEEGALTNTNVPMQSKVKMRSDYFQP